MSFSILKYTSNENDWFMPTDGGSLQIYPCRCLEWAKIASSSTDGVWWQFSYVIEVLRLVHMFTSWWNNHIFLFFYSNQYYIHVRVVESLISGHSKLHNTLKNCVIVWLSYCTCIRGYAWRYTISFSAMIAQTMLQVLPNDFDIYSTCIENETY